MNIHKLWVPKISFKELPIFEYGLNVLINIENIKDDDAIIIELNQLIDEEESKYHSIEILVGINTLKVGKQTGEIKAMRGKNEETFQFSYFVKDTQNPIISGVKDISITEGDKFDLKNLKIEAMDPIDGVINHTFEGSYDSNKKGSYTIDVIAIDQHNNKSKESFTLEVKERPVINFVKPTIINGHIIVNKKHGIPSNWATREDPTALKHFHELVSEMKRSNMKISSSYSGFRTEATQRYLYTNYVKNYGQAAADISSAKPGFSEHQSGLAFDLMSTNGTLLRTEPEITWVRVNAHRFGFVVRYPEGKTHITGYKHEPWHIRYMGDDAVLIYESGLTLEEYFNIPG